MRIDGIYVLYRVIQYLGLPFILLYLAFRGLKDRRYFASIGERFGWLRQSAAGYQPAPQAIWLHAVSVGEVLCSVELLRALRARFPHAPLFVTSTTLAGRSLALRKLAGLADGVFYAPIDYCFAVRRVLRALRPRVVVIVETEIWPNLYREAKRAGCGLLVVNGRISDRAAPGYAARRWFFRHVLQWPDRILAQSEISRQRYVDAGALPDKVAAAGNLKYDFDPTQVRPADAVKRLIDGYGDGVLNPQLRTSKSGIEYSVPIIWVAASTMPPAHPHDVDEDDAVLDAFQTLAAGRPGLLLLLVPRKPERFDIVAQKLEAAGIRYLRRSALTEESNLTLPGVLLVDSMGELSGLFSLADVVFMGGTLAERGGHNILEPAFFGRPIIVGPHMENFPDIAAEYSAAHAYVEIGVAVELAAAVENLLASPQQSEELGERARKLAEAKRGATKAAVDEIASLYAQEVPSINEAWLIRWPLLALSRVWEAGSKWQRTNATVRRLNTPVISIGGIAMGGVGKTPFVAWLVEGLKAGGLGPAVLTRGYRRRSRQIALLAPGSWAPIRLTGDEPQVLLRAGIGPVGIGPNRFEVGRRMEERFQCGVFVLDDGFQHWRLGRDLDIVLIDALDPFGGGQVFPMGRLREPLEALARADAIVLTRAERGNPYTEIVSRIREHNDFAPVFTSRVIPGPWLDPDGWGDHEYNLSPRAAAFCGLANPDAFWQTLESLGIRPIQRWSFRDHHRYSAREVRRMAAEARDAGAEALVTTQKDAVNLPRNWRDQAAPLAIHALQIGVEVDNEEALLALIRRRIP